MLDLDDPRWGELRHAYGNAKDVPGLLRALALSTGPIAGFQDEPWFSLSSSLCHQGDVYTPSYAALPHIVQIASCARPPIDFRFFALPVGVEIARKTGHGPDIPQSYAADYHHAIQRLMEIASQYRNGPWDQSMLLSISAAQAVAKAHIDIAEALLNLDASWIAKIKDGDLD